MCIQNLADLVIFYQIQFGKKTKTNLLENFIVTELRLESVLGQVHIIKRCLIPLDCNLVVSKIYSSNDQNTKFLNTYE